MRTCILTLFVSVSFASAAASEPHFHVLPGQRLLLNGDSISKGYAFGNYTNPSPLRTLYGIANILMRENLPHPPHFLYLPGLWDGLNPDGTPKTVDTLGGEIQLYIRQGDIRTGDWMIYEDAGGIDNSVHPAPWPNAKDMYRRYREALRGMVIQAEGTVDREHIRLMTMFDYNPTVPWSAWDAPLDDGVHTGNDAIRDEAAALGVPCIDMNRIMDRAESYVESAGWGRLVGPDGIHPNIYGNFVMVLAILDSLGADIATWKLTQLSPHFRHPETGGDVPAIWGFKKDPTDQQRVELLERLQSIVAEEAKKSRSEMAKARVGPPAGSPGGTHTFRCLLHHGRLLDHPATQPEGTTKPASYELGKMFQLDQNTSLLVACLREQGGHDFQIGNDGFIFRNLDEIVPENAIPINRLDPTYITRAGQKSVLAKYGVNGFIVPLDAKLDNGQPHPAAGTGFLLSTALSFLPDRSEVTPQADQFVELYQVRWDGKALKVEKDPLPRAYITNLINIGFNCLPQNEAALCPVVSGQGIEVLLFEYKDGRWIPRTSGGPFSAVKQSAKIAAEKVNGPAKTFAVVRGEIEPSLVKVSDGYLVHTRGPDVDPTGRLYYSLDGLHYYFRSDHWNHTVPQVLNQGLDGELYLTTNIGPGLLRNPLYLFAMRGLSFVDPIIVHDEKNIRLTRGKEVPFCDHGMSATIFLNGRWRHFILYRVLDLKETNGQGAPPMPQTGLYLAELEYDSVTHVPFRF